MSDRTHIENEGNLSNETLLTRHAMSWFGWGSPVGLGLFLICVAIALALFRFALLGPWF